MRGRRHFGPVPHTDDPVVVSLTEFTAARLRDLPAIAAEGIRLSRAWWAMPGAISVTLYIEPWRRRGGSLSVWATEEDLRRFVALPRHVAIMRRFRERVTVRAATWRAVHFRTSTAWAEREARLSQQGP